MDLSQRVFTNADQEVVQYDGSPISWRVSAYVIVEKDDQILLIKNRTEKLYDIPGGGVEIGESIEEAISREAVEEAGVQIKLGELVHYHQSWFKHANGKFYQTLQLAFRAQLNGELGKPTESDIEWVGFVSKNELSRYGLPDFVQKALKKL